MIGGQPAVQLRGVGVRIADRWILCDVDFNVAAGTCAAILGPNGSGKSTLARVIMGHVWPTRGECSILGEAFGQTDLHELRRSIRLIQPAGPYDVDPQLTARQAVLTGYFGTIGLYGHVTPEMEQNAEQRLEQVGLSHVIDQRYATLSSGERVRCLVARAMVGNPKLLLLDEPTAGLDLLAREQVLMSVQRMFEREDDPPTVIMITHHVEELPPITSQVLLLDEGRVAASGVPGEVLQSEVLSRVYRCPVEVAHRNGRFYLHVAAHAWTKL